MMVRCRRVQRNSRLALSKVRVAGGLEEREGLARNDWLMRVKYECVLHKP